MRAWMIRGLFVVGLVAPGFDHLFANDTPAAPSGDELDAVTSAVNRLGDDDYLVREAATRELFQLGPDVAPRLHAGLAQTSDPEARRRLRYILDNLTPPGQAVLVVRSVPGSDLAPGMIITHVNSHPVHDRTSLREQMVRGSHDVMLRVRVPEGPRDIGPIRFSHLSEVLDYVGPRGETLALALRLYATGYVEQAYELARQAPGPIPEAEWSAPLRARIAYAAGHGEEAFELMADHLDEIRATGVSWSSPSSFDLRGPGRAPFHMEWAMATNAGPSFYETRNDPDLRVQRTLAPAGRSIDALTLAAGYWRNRYRDALRETEGAGHVAGNQLAVTAWMFHELDLRSECCRLIEPRSAILRASGRGYRKWIRVDTDAWPAFLAGDPSAALDGFYEDAFDVLQRPPRPGDARTLTRNPHVAARLAFFLYQLPDDPRIDRTLSVVRHYTHPALADYLKWMLYALTEDNRREIRKDLQSCLPHLLDERVFPAAKAVALLEYVQRDPSAAILRTARQRIAASTADVKSEAWLVIADALVELSANRPRQARGILRPLADHPEAAALWHTASFLSNPPISAANHALLRYPILVVPMGPAEQHWLVLSRDRRLMHFDAENNLLTAIKRPTATWFPNPLTWPWIGREESTGRVWGYARRRVIEIKTDAAEQAPRLNIDTESIPAFQKYVAPCFSRFAEIIPTVRDSSGENGEFLRREIQANCEFVADPDLPEIAMIDPLQQSPRIVHAALRGGGRLLIDFETGRAWTSHWISEQLGLDTPPTFFAQALWTPAEDGSPIVMLLSDQGLIRFDVGAATLVRIALPGDEPYPPLVPESTPYERRDPRFFYCARLPEDGGAVYRLTLANGAVEQVDMINEVLPARYYDIKSRARIRELVNRRFVDSELPDVQSFITETINTVTSWSQEQEKTP